MRVHEILLGRSNKGSKRFVKRAWTSIWLDAKDAAAFHFVAQLHQRTPGHERNLEKSQGSSDTNSRREPSSRQ